MKKSMLKRYRSHSLLVLAATMLISLNSANASDQDPVDPVQTHIEALQIPGQALRSFDISVVDQVAHIYALSDRSNHGIDLINTKSCKYIGRISGFTGAGKGSAGPNGLVITGNGELWAGDGNSKVKVADLKSEKIISTVFTGGKGRVDELAYDRKDRIVIAANDEDTPPFVTFISENRGHKIKGRLKFKQATNGLEQPVWDSVRNLVYIAIPEINSDAKHGAIAVINPITQKLIRLITVEECMPAGMALGAKGNLVVGCSDDAVKAGFSPKSLIVNPRDGSTLATFHQVGGSDEVWSDGNRFYLAAVSNRGGPVVGIIDATSEKWVANIPTGPHAHSVAVDADTGKIFVPRAAGKDNKLCPTGCVSVYTTK